MSTERDPIAEALIEDGRLHYSAKRYKQALECFTRVRTYIGADRFRTRT
jgi:hypothetical protein